MFNTIAGLIVGALLIAIFGLSIWMFWKAYDASKKVRGWDLTGPKPISTLVEKGETFTRYDTADCLKSEEDIARYLESVMIEGRDDPELRDYALEVVARARVMNSKEIENPISKRRKRRLKGKAK